MSFSSDIVSGIPPHVFVEFRKKKEEMIKLGIDVIDLGIGDPDLPTPQHIVDKLVEEMSYTENFKYPNFIGCDEYREAVAKFYKQQYDVDLNPEMEVVALIGSKEGIVHLVPSIINPGDYVLIPDPGYPTYKMATYMARGRHHYMPLKAKSGFKPKLNEVPKDILTQSKLMFLNYPSNPTSATVDINFYNEAVRFAKENGLVLASDFAYGLITYDDYKAPSILQAEGAKDVAVEFGSLSKSFSMTGWRIGFAVGNKEIIRSLTAIKNNTDNGQFTPIQKAGAYALTNDLSCVEKHNDVYKERLTMMVSALQSIGIKVERPKGGFFIWAPVPDGYTSKEFSNTVFEQTGVILTPGSVFGPSGEGYFRVSMSVPNERLHEAIERIKTRLSFN